MKRSSGVGRQLVVVLVVIVLSAAGGMATYKFVLGPRFDSAMQPHKSEGTDSIPLDSVAIEFPEAQAAVQNAGQTNVNSVLMYAVSIVCANEATKALVEKHKDWFVAMLSDLHRNRTKEELNDAAVQKSILEQACEQANSILRRLQEKPNPEIKIIQVLHLKFAVFTL